MLSKPISTISKIPAPHCRQKMPDSLPRDSNWQQAAKNWGSCKQKWGNWSSATHKNSKVCRQLTTTCSWHIVRQMKVNDWLKNDLWHFPIAKGSSWRQKQRLESYRLAWDHKRERWFELASRKLCCRSACRWWWNRCTWWKNVTRSRRAGVYHSRAVKIWTDSAASRASWRKKRRQ